MSKSDTYRQSASEILTHIGGKENVAHLTHCITRLRFSLKDQSKADLDAVKAINAVIGVKLQNGQVQVIIGQHVGEVYQQVIALAGLSAETMPNDVVDTEKKPLTPKRMLDNVLGAVSGSITPAINLFLGAGMLKVILTLLGPSVFNLLSADSMTSQFLTIVSDAAFYFLPIFVGGFAAKQFKTNEALGMLMGAMLVYPGFIALAEGGGPLSVFGLPVTAVSYANTILPAILIVWIMSYVYKLFQRISPKMLISVIAPLATVLVMIPLAYCVLGPLGAILGNYITSFLLWLYENTGMFGIAIITAVFPFLVMAGMHSALVPTMLMMLSTYGYDVLVLFPSLASNMAIGAAVLAVVLRVKQAKLRSEVLVTSVTAIVGGVTEPALFGYLMRYKRPLIGVVAGGFAGGLVAGLLQVKCYAFSGTGGIFSLPSYVGADANNLIFTVISIAAAMAVSFIVTYLVGIDTDAQAK